jgi:thiol-disulfide isomerase/thioredoxin
MTASTYGKEARMSLRNRFFFGLGVGVALTMAAYDIGGRYLENRETFNANPWLIHPFPQPPVAKMLESSENLPRPVLPMAPRAVHDHWTFRALDGKPATLDNFKGKVVFLNFWSTSCGPCIVEMPGIEKLQASMQSEPVAFLAVAQGDEQSVRGFLRRFPLRLPVYLAGTDIPQDLGPQAVPRTFILDRSGREVFRDVGGLNWDDENARRFIRSLEVQ